eukprot:5660569-Prorocentrum_lima.AAC.1
MGDLSFEGSVIEDSDVPALLGLRTIEALHGIVDTRTTERKMYVCADPSDLEVKIRPGAGSVHVLQLVQAPS